ncbi:MAG: glycosyltransferase [Bacteroidota bacterium]
MKPQQKKNKVLFISNDASLTGAPVMLLHLLKFICENDLWEIHILLNRGGPLEGSFKSMGDTVTLKQESYTKEKNKLKKGVMKMRMTFKKLKISRSSTAYDFVFNNTIANGSLVRIFHKKNIPVISYIHELENVISYFNKNGQAQKTFLYSSLFIAPSNIVRENLLQNHQIPPGKICTLNYYFPGYETDLPEQDKKNLTALFVKKYNIPENKFLVFGMGTADVRKGFDYFIEICAIVTKRETSIHFVWLGNFTDTFFEKDMKNIIKDKSLEQKMTVTGKVPFDKNNLIPANIFALTSREDPYPLVVLDAAFLQVPSIAFDGAGGAPEFIQNDAGWLIEGFSLTKFAEKIIHLKNNSAEIDMAGKNALQKAKLLHGNKSLTINQLQAIEKKIKTL